MSYASRNHVHESLNACHLPGKLGLVPGEPSMLDYWNAAHFLMQQWPPSPALERYRKLLRMLSYKSAQRWRML